MRPPAPIYLTGVHREATVGVGLGLLTQPGSGYLAQVERYAVWAADNGCFNPKSFTIERWKTWLRDAATRGGTCLFATAPDVVADADRTQRRADRHLQFIRSLGLPAALVAQDLLESSEFDCNCGARDACKAFPTYGYPTELRQAAAWCQDCGRQASAHVDTVDGFLRYDTHLEPMEAEWSDPTMDTVEVTATTGGYLTPQRAWAATVDTYSYTCRECLLAAGAVDRYSCTCDWWGSFDVLFIGGTTEWKLGEGAAWLMEEAHRHGKWVHMGRVNSKKRYDYAASLGCDSVDGTYLAYGPDKNLPQLLGWVRSAWLGQGSQAPAAAAQAAA